jgi:hypothetical protein
MKMFTIRVFATAVLASALSGFASAASLHVHIPFGFVVGNSKLPAGDYVIQEDNGTGIVFLQNQAAKSAAAVLSFTGRSSFQDQAPRLVFERRNGQTVLTQIQTSSTPSRMLPGAMAALATR